MLAPSAAGGKLLVSHKGCNPPSYTDSSQDHGTIQVCTRAEVALLCCEGPHVSLLIKDHSLKASSASYATITTKKRKNALHAEPMLDSRWYL